MRTLATWVWIGSLSACLAPSPLDNPVVNAEHQAGGAAVCTQDSDCDHTMVCSAGVCLAAGGDRAVCGNGVVDEGEACDDGNAEDNDACSNACVVARCGDGVVRTDLAPADSEYEQCDDGNQDDTDACTNARQNGRCGDGIVRADADEGESRDDGNEINTDAHERMPGCALR